jgi:hypothetical protein
VTRWIAATARFHRSARQASAGDQGGHQQHHKPDIGNCANHGVLRQLQSAYHHPELAFSTARLRLAGGFGPILGYPVYKDAPGPSYRPARARAALRQHLVRSAVQYRSRPGPPPAVPPAAPNREALRDSRAGRSAASARAVAPRPTRTRAAISRRSGSHAAPVGSTRGPRLATRATHSDPSARLIHTPLSLAKEDV